MFTGIVEEVGRLRGLIVREASAVLEIEARGCSPARAWATRSPPAGRASP